MKVFFTCLILSINLSLVAADNVATRSDQTRQIAEAELASARQRIATEYAALLKQVHSSLAASEEARLRLNSAASAAEAARTELASLRTEQKRRQQTLQQLQERAAVAGRLPLTAGQTIPLEDSLAAIEKRAQQLPKKLALQYSEESIIARHGRPATVPVLRLGEARAMAFGPDHATSGLLAKSADGQAWIVNGPPLPPHLSSASLTDGLPAYIALDASGQAALQPEPVHRTFAEWIAAGRFFIWPIIAVFVLGMLIALERFLTLMSRRVDPHRLIAVASALGRDGVAAAQALVASATTPLDRVLHAGLSAHDRSREAREAAVEQALIGETGYLTRGLPAIAVLAGVAPLLGLLGTVTGMIDMFGVIAAQGSGNAKSLSGGISEALICTQAGMLVAIPLLLLHAWLARLADRRAQLLEEAACGVLGLSEHGDVRPTT
jgi:biopolymer transport protein ExbB